MEKDLRPDVLYDAFVEFRDKGKLNDQDISDLNAKLEKEFNYHAVNRRKKRRMAKGLFDERDYPTPHSYIQAVVDTGANVLVHSRWMNGVTVRAFSHQLQAIKQNPIILEISCYHEYQAKKISSKPAFEAIAKPLKSPGLYGHSRKQLEQLGIDRLHEAGFTGSGVRLAVIDCGFNLSHKAFTHRQNKIKIFDQWDFVDNDQQIIPDPGIDKGYYDHGSFILGLIAANVPGELIGSAPDAELMLYHAEDGDHEYFLEEVWFAAAIERAERMGADIVTSSLVLYGGYHQEEIDGKTAMMTRAMNIALENGLICFAPVGNLGHDLDPSTSHLTSPGDCPLAITVGAVTPDGSVADFSSDGKRVSGTSKPEVMALGKYPITISLNGIDSYTYIDGTSVATPILAGGVACLLQVHPEWTIGDIRNSIFRSGEYFLLHGKSDPLFIVGYGIPDLFKAAGIQREAHKNLH